MCKEKKPRVHAELIKAWADGAEIQFYSEGVNKWLNVGKPEWKPCTQYRIKPEPNDVEKYGIEVGDVWCLHKNCYPHRGYAFTVGTVSNRGVVLALSTSELEITSNSVLLFRKGVVNKL